MGQDTLRLTTEQRIAALEQENVVLQDRTKRLGKRLRQLRQLINDYIRQTLVTVDQDAETSSNIELTEAVCAGLCKQRCEHVERRLDARRSYWDN